MAVGETVTTGTDVSSRIVTDGDLDAREPALVVRWLKWDSEFRADGVRPGDRIVAVDGAPLQVPAEPTERARVGQRMVGQVSEPLAWAEAGRKDGDPLHLTLRRKRLPRGWETIEVSGALRADRYWRNADNHPILGPGGPDEMERDGFAGNWGGWYGTAATTWQRVWARHEEGGLVQSVDIDVDESSARVPKLTATYPGPFADAVAADWAALVALVAGREYELEPGALDYRELGEQRVQEIGAAGAQARGAFLAAHAAELIAPFPSIDPILGDRAAVAGKLVELPAITQREWISQGDRTVFIFAQGSDCYIAEMGGATERMLVTQRRYERIVAPDVTPRYEVIGRIQPEPTMALIGDRALFALRVEPVAATVGGAFFVDLTSGADPAPFAGEETLRTPAVEPPGADAPPEAVLAAMVGALKVGDLELWKSTYADWTFSIGGDGRPVISAWGPPNLDSNWEQGRRRILVDVVDIRPVWIDDPVTVFGPDRFEGAPTIEQTTIEVDHLRPLDDDSGRARTFRAVGLTRRWTLQRLDGGPWRITTNAGV